MLRDMNLALGTSGEFSLYMTLIFPAAFLRRFKTTAQDSAAVQCRQRHVPVCWTLGHHQGVHGVPNKVLVRSYRQSP